MHICNLQKPSKTIKNHQKPSKTIKNHQKPSKTIKNQEPSKTHQPQALPLDPAPHFQLFQRHVLRKRPARLPRRRRYGPTAAGPHGQHQLRARAPRGVASAAVEQPAVIDHRGAGGQQGHLRFLHEHRDYMGIYYGDQW